MVPTALGLQFITDEGINRPNGEVNPSFRGIQWS